MVLNQASMEDGAFFQNMFLPKMCLQFLMYEGVHYHNGSSSVSLQEAGDSHNFNLKTQQHY